VVAMDNIILEAINKYYKLLEQLGYCKYSESFSIIVLCFYRDFVFHDYRGILNRKDYHLIEKALECLFGRNCLISYPDYLKMGKLHIGSITELAHRLKTLEDTEVLKPMETENPESDIDIIEE
jgi:hypothetical protein